MPKEKKYVKLEAGERKAVRQSGAMKTARTTGLKTNIYSGEKGGLFTNTSPKSTVPGAATRTKSTPSVDTKRQAGSSASKTYNNDQYVQQGMINQKEFEKTRLGARVVRKADKAVAKIEKKGGEAPASRYIQGAPKATPAKKQIKVAGLVSGQPGHGLNKRGYANMTSEQKAAAKKTAAEKKQSEKRESKKQKFDSKLEKSMAKSEIIGARKDARANARAARKNS